MALGAGLMFDDAGDLKSIVDMNPIERIMVLTMEDGFISKYIPPLQEVYP